MNSFGLLRESDGQNLQCILQIFVISTKTHEILKSSNVFITAFFHPAGAPGLLYWHALTPVHALIFTGLARAIAARAERAADLGASDPQGVS